MMVGQAIDEAMKLYHNRHNTNYENEVNRNATSSDIVETDGISRIDMAVTLTLCVGSLQVGPRQTLEVTE